MPNTPDNTNPAPGHQDSNAGAGNIPNPPREAAQEALRREAPHPGGAENAAGMDHGAGAQKQQDRDAEEGR